MLVTVLSKNAGILEPIASLLGLIMNGIYEFFNLFGIQNIALIIIIFTFIVRALMLPLTIKQQKFQKLSARMNPELQKIQAKYKGKKDQASMQKMQIEQQAIYEKYGANPTSGCLPLLITLPLMFALYDVIINVPAYVTKIKGMYQPIANEIYHVSNYSDKLIALAKTTSRMSNKTNFSSTDRIITLLYNLSTDGRATLAKDFPALNDSITSAFHNINHINNFFGMNIIDKPGLAFPGILIPILAAVLSYVQSKQVQVKTVDNKDNPAASAMNSMLYVMPAMQFFFCITFPLGIGVYWVATSIFTIIQQFFVNRVLDKMNVDELIEKSQEKAAKKKAKRINRYGNVTSPMSLRELATRQTKNIESTIDEKVNSTDKTDESEQQSSSEETTIESNEDNQVSAAPKSISEIANLLKNKKL